MVSCVAATPWPEGTDYWAKTRSRCSLAWRASASREGDRLTEAIAERLSKSDHRADATYEEFQEGLTADERKRTLPT